MKPLPLAKPCTADWSSMRPVPGGRHCERCDRVVHNLATATPTRVRALRTLYAREGFCARQIVDGEGNLVLAQPRTRELPRAPLALGLLALAMRPALAPAQEPPPAAATPEADRDTDGRPDAQDRCPDQAAPTEDGCPQAELVLVGGIGSGPAQVLHFERRRVDLDPKLGPLVAEIAQVLLEQPDIRRLALIGHASTDEGDAARTRKLGLDRANAVREALVARGVQRERLVVASWGIEHPIDDNRTTEGRAHNRRVELQICDDTCALPPDQDGSG